jgi:predicted nucleic acid-binding protein
VRPAGVPAGLRETVEEYFDAELAGDGSAGWWLRQAARESVITARMAARAAVSVHRALLAGATLAQVADAAGVSRAEAERWMSWAGGQRELARQVPGLGVSGRDYQIAAAAVSAGLAGSGQTGGKRE